MSWVLSGRRPFDTIVCDIDGVVVVGKTPVPGAGEALRRLCDVGMNILFVSNNSTKTPASIAERITSLVGFETTADAVVNSGAATARFIAGEVTSAYVVGTDGLRATLRAGGVGVTTDWAEADAIVVGLDFDVTYRALAEASLAVHNGAAFYATNTDSTFPTEEGLYPGAGALAAVVERATGRLPIVCGKPHRPMRLMLEDLVGAHPLVVGDRPETDIALGKAEGWATALVLSGVTTAADDVEERYIPDRVLDSISDLPQLLGLPGS